MRFGFVGLGRAARMFHLPALKQVPGAEVVGGADAFPEQRQSWEQETRTPTYETLEELIDGARPEVVVVATPPDSHAELCLRAIAAGAHVYCEKPFVETLEQADRVIAAAEAAGRRVAVNHEFREKPIFTAVREGIASERYGRLVFCQIWQLMQFALRGTSRPPGAPRWRTGPCSKAASTWWISC